MELSDLLEKYKQYKTTDQYKEQQELYRRINNIPYEDRHRPFTV